VGAALKKPDACRFCRLFAISVSTFAALAGALTTLQFLLSVGTKFGGREYASFALVLNVARSLAPAAVGSALALALVLWAHPLSASEVAAELRRILLRGLAIAVPSYLAAGAIAIAGGFLVATAFRQTPSVFGQGFGVVGWADLAVGLVSTALDAALIAFLAWRFLARLQAGRSSLPAKLILVLTVTVPLRATVALLFAMVLPS
jgi:hypothetical protein